MSALVLLVLTQFPMDVFETGDAFKEVSRGDYGVLMKREVKGSPYPEHRVEVLTEFSVPQLCDAVFAMGTSGDTPGLKLHTSVRDEGDVLLKVARLEDLYLAIEVPERDIQYVREGAAGNAAFASIPGQRFAFVVERIEPAARTSDSGSHFNVRCRFTESPADWWRPGMTGIAKVDAGSRSLLWLSTHRTVDFLRMWWW